MNTTPSTAEILTASTTLTESADFCLKDPFTMGQLGTTITTIISIVLFSTETYGLLSLLVYGVFIGGYFGRTKRRETLNTVRCRPPSFRREATALYCLAIISIVFTIGKSSLTLWSLVFASSAQWCAIEDQVIRCVFILCFAPIYLYLWIRQFILYKNPHLRQLFSPNLRRFSNSVLVMIVVTEVFFLVSYLSSWVKDVYCVHDGFCYNPKSNVDALFVVGTTACLYFQGCLLFLFIYPVVSMNKRSVTASNNPLNTRTRIMSLVKKCCLSAVVCVIGDISVLLAGVAVKYCCPLVLIHIAADLDLTVNVFCLVACFENWKMMLFPWNKLGVCRFRSRTDDSTPAHTISLAI